MGRPSKKYVDYFPHDTDASERRTLFVIESNYGNNGYAFWFKLLEVLGRKDGHFLDLNDDNELIFLSAKTRLSTEETKLILDLLAKLGSIDRELWAKRIVWSQNFVDRITDVYRIRKKKPPSKLDIMGADFDPFINGVSTAETPVSTESIGFIPQKSAETPVSTAESTQSKLKENRIEENRINNKKNVQPKDDDRNFVREKFTEFKTILISEEDYKKLVEGFGDNIAYQKIAALYEYIGSKGKKYKNHYLTILNWERMRKEKEGHDSIDKPHTTIPKGIGRKIQV